MTAPPIRVRAAVRQDLDALQALALRAWEPVHASLAAVLGDELSALLTPDWRRQETENVREMLDDDDVDLFVAVDGDQPVDGDDDQRVGFVALRVHDEERRIGEIAMLGVDPAHHRRGVGRILTTHALAQLRAAGMRVAMVETGGDPGHASARALYEDAGFTQLPIARYVRSLDDDDGDA